ncbi:DNA polymerase IV [Geodermatophilus sp. YIM 151500]|uniref:DNA polymerase IV n=1 Tax=Geodermatophilus sp. YIM 151500 TaxID=2984531 RepID=UPI0021E4BF80|nr:DNA polymerase IV [Geodermatophilus sp. YIM 151500]MCV2491856.1 DNA polymerase IV [Geodermatophilus sp. YIM 151500]
MRREPSILHVDLDAFFAAVEQRDKPSLRGRPVVVGGVGGRGVVATASYEARAYGARSAMSTAEARRRCPAGTAFLGGRFGAYRRTSDVVMGLLRELSPLVEPVSLDEAYVDLAAGPGHDLSVDGVTALARSLKERIATATGGVTGSVGAGTSKLMAKIASDLDKPDGLVVVVPGTELDVLQPLPVTRLGGVGPATAERLRAVGVRTVGDLARKTLPDLVSLAGRAHGTGLHALARAEDDRPVVADREAKSVSAEETFATDLTDLTVLGAQIDDMAARVGGRLRASATSGRTVTLKLRRYDFTTLTRSSTLPQPTDDPRQIAAIARRLLVEAGTGGGLRLLGVGVSGLSPYAQGDLFAEDDDPAPGDEDADAGGTSSPRPAPVEGGAAVPDPVARWWPGQDVRHDEHGAGWVWGRGLGRVTVRFEGPLTAPGPVRTLPADDPALHAAEPPDWRPDGARSGGSRRTGGPTRRPVRVGHDRAPDVAPADPGRPGSLPRLRGAVPPDGGRGE